MNSQPLIIQGREEKVKKKKRTFFSLYKRRMANKLKPILPSLREKKRYLVFEVISEKDFSAEEINKEITEKFKELFGIFGLSEAGLMMLKNKYQSKKGIIKVNHKNVDKLKTTFTFINSINNQKAKIISLGLSGILKKAEKKYMA